jgi:hypothetical protein
LENICPEWEEKNIAEIDRDTSSSVCYITPDEDDVSGNQNNCYCPLHSESIARCKHHMEEKLVYCCTYLEKL